MRTLIAQASVGAALRGAGRLASWMDGVIADNDIRRAVAPNAFQAGLQYQMDRRVRNLRVAADGATIDAQVLGSGRSPYYQTVQLIRAFNGKLAVAGSCTCPVGFNCKHVAAFCSNISHGRPPASLRRCSVARRCRAGLKRRP